MHIYARNHRAKFHPDETTKPYGLSTLATVAVSPVLATVAEFGDYGRQCGQAILATVAGFGDSRQFGDSRRFRRQIVAKIGDYNLQCGQGFRLFEEVALRRRIKRRRRRRRPTTTTTTTSSRQDKYRHKISS